MDTKIGKNHSSPRRARLRSETERSISGTRSHSPSCRRATVDKFTNPIKMATTNQNVHGSISPFKSVIKNKKSFVADVVKLKEAKAYSQLNEDNYEETFNPVPYGCRLDQASVRHSKKNCKIQNRMIESNVNELMKSVKAKIENIPSDTLVSNHGSHCLMDRINSIKNKLKTMTDLEQIKAKEMKSLVFSIPSESYTNSQHSKTNTNLQKYIVTADDKDRFENYAEVFTQKFIDLQSNVMDTNAFENIEKKLERVQSCVQHLQMNLNMPFFNEVEITSSRSSINSEVFDTKDQIALNPPAKDMDSDNIQNDQSGGAQFEKFYKNARFAINFQQKDILRHNLNEIGDSKLRHLPPEKEEQEFKVFQKLLDETATTKKERVKNNDGKYRSEQENPSTDISSMVKYTSENLRGDFNPTFEDECYRLLKEIQMIQKGSVNLLHQLNKEVKAQGKIIYSSSGEVPITLCGNLNQKLPRDIDTAVLQNVFGAPAQAHYGQVAPVVPDQGSLSDPDYWDNQDVFRPSSLSYDMFDWTLTKRVAAFSTDNFLLSPLGLKLALAILTEAATGATQAELSSVLGFGRDRYAIRNKFASIIGSLQSKSSQYTLNLGSRVYVDGVINPRQKLAAISQEYYRTEIKSIDFKHPTSALQINAWVYNVTEGKIPALVTQGELAETVVMIINALYFQGTWRHQFAPNATKLDTFYVTPTLQKQTMFMNVQNTFYCSDSARLDAKILRLPYLGDKFSMYIVVPNALTGLPRVIDNISDLRQEILLLSERVVDVSIPKFEFDYSSQLDGVMKDMGVRQAFEDTASFPGISRGQTLAERLKVSKILQKAGIEVNELGSTVYSATEISLVNKFGVDNDAVMDLKANKPFLFFIEDENTRQLLFTGRISDPSLAKTELKHH